jgi:hypothetical protein
MTNLIDILKEIKINNPSDVFHVTDEGKLAAEDYYKIKTLLEKYIGHSDIDLDQILLEIKGSQYLDLLQFSVFVDERIINKNAINKYSEVLDKGERIVGWEEDELKGYLENFKKHNWIK